MPLRVQRYDNFGNYANNWGILCEKLEEELNTQRRDYNDNTDNMYARQQCERESVRQYASTNVGCSGVMRAFFELFYQIPPDKSNFPRCFFATQKKAAYLVNFAI